MKKLDHSPKHIGALSEENLIFGTYLQNEDIRDHFLVL